MRVRKITKNNPFPMRFIIHSLLSSSQIVHSIIFCTFVEKIQPMEKSKINREEALAKFKAAKNKKQECLKRLEKSMKEIYKEQTGEEAKNFFAL